MITPVCKKGTQAINYFARKKGGEINKMKAIKLLYLADRYHLRKYGRPVVGDRYYAMKWGAVGSTALNIANFEQKSLDRECLGYIKEFLVPNKKTEKVESVISKKEVDLDVFSQTDIDALEVVFKEFGDQDQFELALLTHDYPEWYRFEKEIMSGKKKRVPMDYTDFFKNSRKREDRIFALAQDHLTLSEEMFVENFEAEKVLQ
mgnify:CR=1 FL=1